MLKYYARLAAMMALVGFTFGPAAHACMQSDAQISAPVAVVPPPPAAASPIRHVWQKGYYVWTPEGKRWQPGVWLPWAPGYGRGPSHLARHRAWNHDRSWHP